MDAFQVAMNEREAQMSVIGGEVPCAQAGQEFLAAKMVKDQGTARSWVHRSQRFALCARAIIRAA